MSGKISQKEIELLRDQVIDLVGKDPKKAAIILTDWMNPPKKKKTREPAKKKAA